ncbi:tartrate dehydrogenase [Bacillus mangrovi]|uniref:D-malate dehydrogenase (decarboxylating) n=1 Tax=Metabacillus mangrovi TaxID=1491830 RepID=A0A7X2S7S1_9BACI|nr:tartrate dehydrogenase [Metabacillus mangrovi]MTH54937.1 tartrate dehydrogenase [Metabacillus mangrovi]
MRKIEIAALPGDGVGVEVTEAAKDVLHTLARAHGGVEFSFTDFPWSCDYYSKHGEMMPKDAISTLSQFEAIFLGAVGNPAIVPDHISLWGMLIKIRREFELSVNVRPAKKVKGITSPLANPKDFDLIVIRENSEGEYSEVGGRIHRGEHEMAIQNAVFTRRATEKVIRYAFQLAEKRNNRLVSATKSNGIVHSMPFWDEVTKSVAAEYPHVHTQSTHIDALAAFFVSKPAEFDVVVASNLFGDILTDIGSAIMGSIGIAPSANLNLEGRYPSMFEPVHGSAPDIAGKGIANPIGQIWTAKMMLDHFGFEELGQVLMDSMEEVTEAGIKTPDIGGTANTRAVTEAVKEKILETARV